MVSLPKAETISKAETGRKVHRAFSLDNNWLLLVCSDGEIMVYDWQTCYVGSYFTLGFDIVTQCGVSSNYKYISLLYENNDIEVANIYTQDMMRP